MRRIPVDTSRVRFLGTGKTAARAQYAELSDGTRRRVPDAQDKNADGVPMWIVDVLVDDPDAERAEIASVKVAAFDEPRTKLGEEVRFRGLIALPYVQNGTSRVAVSFSADGIDHSGAKPAAA